jgi:hypothetical protein
MLDSRSPLEKVLWERIGPPLYYCEECLRGVKVTPVDGGEPVIKRPCGWECGNGIIAPRSAVCVGKGGASIGTRAAIGWMKAKAFLTGRDA